MFNENNIVDFLTIFIVVIILFIYYESRTSELIYVEAPYDRNKYLVRNLPDKEDAANILAKTRQKLMRLCKNLEKKYPDDKKVKRLLKRFNPNNISETAGNSNYTSYSINKGEKIVMCIRAKNESNSFIDENTIYFVACHEISHIMTYSIGHTDEFWNNFKFLLQESVESNVYECEDYTMKPKKYCGIQVTDSPLKCSK